MTTNTYRVQTRRSVRIIEEQVTLTLQLESDPDKVLTVSGPASLLPQADAGDVIQVSLSENVR